MKILKRIAALLLTGLLVFALNTRFGNIPPLGKFFSPFEGFWRNAEQPGFPESKALKIPGLKEEVFVEFDDMLVPHIFAKNMHDAYLVQGYITAKHRLWQMEFQTHAAAGRVSEIVGSMAKEYDRFQRRIGMTYAAEQALEEIMKNPVTKEATEAYASGVNAYIAELKPRDYPIEYKILDYAPEPWTPLKSALLLKYMAWDLSGASDDLAMTKILERIGAEKTAELFPSYPSIIDPIIPSGVPLDFEPVPLPASAPELPAESESLRASLPSQPDKDNGSNNWVIGAERSATGYPILANDPHLSLNLPSLWYMVQLITPDMNVCGVSLPGAPGVILGFNKKIAWGVTNVAPDVTDWYKIHFKDAYRNEYRYKNGWQKTRKRKEVIRIRGEEPVVDTVIYTVFGPVALQAGEKGFNTSTPQGYAMRWAAHDSSNELFTFLSLNKAQNYEQYTEAISHFICPAQNFAYADNEKNIALWVNGRYTLKRKDQGKFLLDGSTDKDAWKVYIPQGQNPHVKNPSRGYVSSANQYPVDSLYPYYLNWEFASFERGMRINQRLAAMNRATPDSMRSIQNDNYSLRAEYILPTLLSQIDKKSLSKQESKIFQILSSWNLYNNPDEYGPTIFTTWWNLLNDLTWKDDLGNDTRYPAPETLIRLLKERPDSEWFDDKRTKKREVLSDIALKSFQMSCDTLTKRLGNSVSVAWKWGNFKSTAVLHLAKIPGFGRTKIFSGGGSGIVNALKERHGPSWRTVIAPGATPTAFGIYPGGQSGNPGSPFYDNMIDPWSRGELKEILFEDCPGDNTKRVKTSMKFSTR